MSKDDEYTVSADAIIDLYTAGEECYELIQRMTDVIDNSYPLIMQSMFSGLIIRYAGKASSFFF